MEPTKNEAFRAFHRELRHMMRTHHAVCERRISTLGIHPAQHMLLMHLTHNDRISSQKELAAHMHISPAALAVSLAKLEAGGYIERSTDAGDCRIKSILITPRGREVVGASCALFDEIDRETFAGLSEEELATVTALLQKAHDNLKRMKEAEE